MGDVEEVGREKLLKKIFDLEQEVRDLSAVNLKGRMEDDETIKELKRQVDSADRVSNACMKEAQWAKEKIERELEEKKRIERDNEVLRLILRTAVAKGQHDLHDMYNYMWKMLKEFK